MTCGDKTIDDLQDTPEQATNSERNLKQTVDDLRDTLESLVDLQNGCPLATYREEWETTMLRARKLLREIPDNTK